MAAGAWSLQLPGSFWEVQAMRQDHDSSAGAGGNVHVYERPSRWTTLAPLLWIILTAILLLIVFVLLMRQS
jgi:hypothetical protein